VNKFKGQSRNPPPGPRALPLLYLTANAVALYNVRLRIEIPPIPEEGENQTLVHSVKVHLGCGVANFQYYMRSPWDEWAPSSLFSMLCIARNADAVK